MTNQQGAPEALRLADWLQNAVATYPQVSEDEPGGYCQEVDQVMDEAAAELRRLHAENERLAALVDAQQPAPSAAAATVGHGRTDAEIVAQTVELTKYLLSWKWGLETEGDVSRIWESGNTKALVCWNAACHIQDLLTQTDVWNAVAELDGASSTAPKADSQPAPVLTSATGGDWTQPTTVALRLGDSMQLLCGGKRPPDDMVQQWLDNTSEELQSFAASHGPAWAQGIGLIDAAMVMVDQPTEIRTIDNPDLGHEHRAARAPADSLQEDAARVERERICAAIKTEDDYCVDHGDYMLDSDDCIKIVRGEWVRPDFAIDAARKQGGAA